MYYNWTEQVLFPAERNATIRELEKDIEFGMLTQQEATDRLKDWDAFISKITQPTKKKDLAEHIMQSLSEQEAKQYISFYFS